METESELPSAGSHPQMAAMARVDPIHSQEPGYHKKFHQKCTIGKMYAYISIFVDQIKLVFKVVLYSFCNYKDFFFFKADAVSAKWEFDDSINVPAEHASLCGRCQEARLFKIRFRLHIQQGTLGE